MNRINQQSLNTLKLVLITFIVLSLSSCGKQTFEEYYLAKMAEIGNDVTGVKVIDQIEVENYGVALTATIIDGEGVKYVNMKPYEIIADGWDLKPSSGCGSAYSRLGSHIYNAYCGKVDPRYEGVTDVLLNDEKVKMIQTLDSKYWYTVSKMDTAIIKYVNENGKTLKSYTLD